MKDVLIQKHREQLGRTEGTDQMQEGRQYTHAPCAVLKSGGLYNWDFSLYLVVGWEWICVEHFT